MIKFTTHDFFDAYHLSTSSVPEFCEFMNAYYTEPHRAYHNVEHILRLLELYRIYAAPLAVHELPNWKELYVAILFHDIVYNVGAPFGQNEKDSAKLALEIGPHFFNVNWEIVEKIIMATVHTGEPIELLEARYMVNFDLYDLGTEKYSINSDLIEQEYRTAYKASEYRIGREMFLSKMLTRPSLFYQVNKVTHNMIFSKLNTTAKYHIENDLFHLRDLIEASSKGGIVIK